MKIRLRTHIIPIGNDLPDRVLIPTKSLKPDRIYLLTMIQDDAFSNTYALIKSTLLSESGLEPSELVEITCNYYNTQEFLKIISNIYQIESQDENDLFINISGGTMISVIGTLSAVFFGITPYFAKFDYLNNKIIPEAFIPQIPDYSIQKPKLILIHFLNLIDHYLQEKQKKSLTKAECLELVKHSQNFHGFDGKKPKDYNKLNHRYIHPLLELKYIEYNELEPGQIQLTQEGKFTVGVFGNLIREKKEI